MRQLIEGFEGCRLEPYRDVVGVWTIGYGHTGEDVYSGCDPISQEQADQLLAADLQAFEAHVGILCPTNTQQQFDALVSFAYNLGVGALQGSTLRRMHNAGDYDGAAGQFGRWNHAGGRVLAGLTRRRGVEAQVYANGDYSGAVYNPDC
jgi:lysozyme